MKAELAKGNPVVFGIRQTPISFDRLQGTRTYHWDSNTKDAGSAHALTMIGYDDKRQAFRIINSWGRKWGDRGYAWVGYDTISKLIDEVYVMDVVERPVPIPEPRPDDTPPPTLNDLDLSKIPCSRLSVAGGKDRPIISGFVGYQTDLEKINAATAAVHAENKVDLRPWPQCEALLTLADFLQKNDALVVTVADGKKSVTSGDALTLSVMTPTHATYLYLSYIQADGSVINLLQPKGDVPSPLPARSEFTFGDGENGKARFTVSPPFGQDMVIAIASKSPLFPSPLPSKQTEREYLSAMRTALYAMPAGNAEPRVAAGTIATVETREKTE